MRLTFLVASASVCFSTTFGSVACDGQIAADAATTTAEIVAADERAGSDDRGHFPARPRRLPGKAFAGLQPVAVAHGQPGLTCEGRIAAGLEAIEAARATHGACEVAADCTVDTTPTACGGLDLRAVSFAGQADFQRAVDGVDAAICQSLGAECPIAVASVYGWPQAECVAGQCQLAFAEPEPSEVCVASGERRETTEGCLSCGLAAAKAATALDVAATGLDACEVDADCVQVSDDTGCGSTCGLAINAANMAAWDDARADVAADWCTGGSCPVYAAGCLPQDARCNAGRCELVATW